MTTKIKNLTCVLIFILASISTCIAQDSLHVATRQQKTDVVALRMERELSLSKAQSQRVFIIVLERFETLAKSTGDRNKQLTSANDVALKKLAEVLTAKQLTLYNEARSETKKQKDEYVRKNPNYKFTDQEKEMDF